MKNQEGKTVDLTARVPVTYNDGRKSNIHPNVARKLFKLGRLSYDNKKDETDDTNVSDFVVTTEPKTKEKEGKK